MFRGTAKQLKKGYVRHRKNLAWRGKESQGQERGNGGGENLFNRQKKTWLKRKALAGSAEKETLTKT